MQSNRRRRLVVGSRTSQLAQWQSRHIMRLLAEAWPDLTCELRFFDTKGDRTLDRPLPEIGGKGLFTAELEQALLAGEIDIAVHSLKDLPVENPPGLILGAIPEREDVRDALVVRDAPSLSMLPPGAIVGTSSLRRQAQLLAVRPDLRVRPIRGNVDTRVRKVAEGQYDAAILASAGLSRLGLAQAAAAVLSLDVMLPAPGQGALGVQCRADDEQTLSLLSAIDHLPSREATAAERRFLQELGGGCSAPIAAFARPDGDAWLMDALIASPDGAALIRVSDRGADPLALASQLAARAHRQGADPILSAVRAGLAVAPERPLRNRRVVVTRARSQAPELAQRLQSLGATPILFPTIRIVPFADSSRLDAAIAALPNYDWVIFTSVNGVAVFRERMKAQAVAAGHFDGVRVAAIGPATAGALRDMGVEPHFVPYEFVAERIAEGLGAITGRRILLPRAELARAALVDMLQARGATVEELPAYQTLPATPDPAAIAQLSTADVFTFTSSSTFHNFVSLVGGEQEAARLLSPALVACIGPITAATAREYGFEPQIVAETYTIDGLLVALVSYVQSLPE